MKRAVFTICTLDHVSNAITAINSISSNTPDKNIDYYIFILDSNKLIKNYILIDNLYIFNIIENLNDSICYQHYNTIINKYGHKSNETRWSLKSLILYYLTIQYDKTIYIDTDILFIDNINILLDMIDDNIILTPHFRSIDHPNFHKCNLTDGYFNAGFIGTSNNMVCRQILLWWLKNCIMNCQKNHSLGMYDDQKYLDLMYIHFNDHIKKITHKGCNIAEWNIDNYDIKILNNIDNSFIIDNQYLPIFFHFSSCKNNKNQILKHYYNIYQISNQYYQNIIETNLI